MTGLLDWVKTPEGQGLLSAAFGGLANARRGAPLNSIGGAGMAGLMGYSGALDRQDRTAQEAQQRQLRDMQMKAAQFGLQKTERDMQTDEAIRAAAGRFATPAMPGMGQLDGALPPEMRTGAAMPSKPASFDLGGFSNALMGIDPMKGIELQSKLAKDTPFGKVDPKDYTPASVAKFAVSRNHADLIPARKLDVVNDRAVNLYETPPGTMFDSQDPNKPFGRVGGQVVPNLPFQSFELNRSRAGAPSTSVKIENKMGEGIAAQVGPMLKDSYTAANGAAQQVDAANRIIQAADSGKLIAGPMAGGRLKLAQLSQVLGIGGKDEAAQIANTRQAIRGLAEMTLQGRKQMRGEGAITESEGALAEKANSGNIEDLTVAEIRQLAESSARSARFIYGQHEQMVGNLSSDPNTAGLAKFYKPLPMSNSPKVPTRTPPAPGPGARFLGFE